MTTIQLIVTTIQLIVTTIQLIPWSSDNGELRCTGGVPTNAMQRNSAHRTSQTGLNGLVIGVGGAAVVYAAVSALLKHNKVTQTACISLHAYCVILSLCHSFTFTQSIQSTAHAQRLVLARA